MRAALLVILLAGPAAADEALERQIDHYVAPLVDARELSGVILVARGGEPIAVRIYGLADIESDARMTADTRFRIASITKTFTAAAITILAQRDKLSYKDPLSKFIPSFPSASKITIEHLLLHRSGVGGPDILPCSDATLDDVIADIAKTPLAFEPGTNGRYSNGGYALLARVVEVAGGKSWEAFLCDEIFRPLGLGHTQRDSDERVVTRRAEGYQMGVGAGALVNAPCESAQAAIGSGALLSSARDLLTWAIAVRRETLFKRTAYPYGWGVRKYFDRDAIEQSGILNGFSSYLASYPKGEIEIVVLSNVQTARLTDIGKGLAALALGILPERLRASPATTASTTEQRARFIGSFRNENIATFHIREQNGALYLTWEDAPYGMYLSRTVDGAFLGRQDAMLLRPTDGGLSVSWGGSDPVAFERLKAAR